MNSSIRDFVIGNFELLYLLEYIVIVGIALLNSSFRAIVFKALSYRDLGVSKIWKSHSWVPLAIVGVWTATIILEWSLLNR